MVSIFNKRFCSQLRQARRTLLACTASAAALLSAHTAHGQDAEDLYRGTWVIATPEEGPLFILVKKNGLASYFWGEGTERTVYKGKWTVDGESVQLNWDNGSQHKLSRSGNGFDVTYSDIHNSESYSAQAKQVPREILGQWAKPPTREEAKISDREQAKGFFGRWEINSPQGTYYVFIESDRSAASNWISQSGLKSGIRGSWAKQGSELHLSWNTGHYSILRQNPRGFEYKWIQPGTIIEDDKSEFRQATRTRGGQIPAQWLNAYETERAQNNKGIAFPSRKEARNFYRGDWLIRHTADTYEKITIGRFGGLETSRSATKGDWLMTGQDIYMRWDDGMRKILSPVANGFLLYEYKPGRPLDGVPTRLLPATPENADKLAKHLNGRSEIAAEMRAVAAAAGIKNNTEITSWGSTFMRFAWPFGEDNSENTSTDAILRDSFEEDPKSSDPWWWPLWSEKQEIPADSKAQPEAPTTTSPTQSTTQTQPSASTKTTENKGKWYWPF